MVMSSIPSNRVSENQSKHMTNSAYHAILFHAAVELEFVLLMHAIKIKSTILHTVNHTILTMSVQRIWYWIDKLSPN